MGVNNQASIQRFKNVNEYLWKEAISDYDYGVVNTKTYSSFKRRIQRMEKNITDELEKAEKINEKIEQYLRETNEVYEK